MAVYTNINRSKKRPTRSFKAKRISYVLYSVAAVAYIALFTNFLGFLRTFLMGTFGVFSYAIFSAMFVIAGALRKGRRFNITKKYVMYLLICLVAFLSVIQLAFLGASSATSFAEYINLIYNLQTSVGGVVIGTITYPFVTYLNPVGAYVIFIIILAVMGALIIDNLRQDKVFKKFKTRNLTNFNEYEKEENNFEYNLDEPEETVIEEREPVNVVLNSKLQKEELAKQKALASLGLGDVRNNRFVNEELEENTDRSEIYNEPTEFKPVFEEKSRRPKRIIHDDYSSTSEVNKKKKTKKVLEDRHKQNLAFLRATIPAKFKPDDDIKGTGIENPNKEYSSSNMNKTINERMEKSEPVTKVNNRLNRLNRLGSETVIENKPKVNVENKFKEDLKKLEQLNSTSANKDFNTNPIIPNTNRDRRFNRRSFGEEKQIKPIVNTPNKRTRNFEQTQFESTRPTTKPKKAAYKKPSRYVKPPTHLLNTVSTNMDDFSEEYLEKSKLLEKVLNDFKVPAKVINVTKGPAVTRYELQMPAGISVKKITQHAEDIAMTLASNGAVRIEAPIPGKNAVGVEVPNNQIATIGLKDVVESKEFKKQNSGLAFGLGKDIAGDVQVCNLAKMPHLLVAGATGSGKSVCLNTLIISMLYKYSPEDLKLILIDPKQVEFYVYNGLPHLMLPNVVTDSKKAINAFNWAIDEMERRFNVFQTDRVKNLAEYNEQPEVVSGEKAKLPMIVIIVDELADLMMTSKRDVEEKIMRLAQKARAAGIHLVLATQRPSVDVITGTIKANLPSRIAFSVTSIADSKTVLDGGGAEKLLGKGDMLYAPLDYPEPRRIQGAFVSNNEVKAIVDFVKENNDTTFDEQATKSIMEGAQNNGSMVGANGKPQEFDAIMPQALKLIIESGQASISMIQRRFSVGYARAARIIDQMEVNQFISPSDGSKARKVYITMDEYNERFGG